MNIHCSSWHNAPSPAGGISRYSFFSLPPLHCHKPLFFHPSTALSHFSILSACFRSCGSLYLHLKAYSHQFRFFSYAFCGQAGAVVVSLFLSGRLYKGVQKFLQVRKFLLVQKFLRPCRCSSWCANCHASHEDGLRDHFELEWLLAVRYLGPNYCERYSFENFSLPILLKPNWLL